jgi:hypothetical protein
MFFRRKKKTATKPVAVKWKDWVDTGSGLDVRPGMIGRDEAVTLFVAKANSHYSWKVIPTGYAQLPSTIREAAGNAKTRAAAKQAAETSVGLR